MHSYKNHVGLKRTGDCVQLASVNIKPVFGLFNGECDVQRNKRSHSRPAHPKK